MLTITPTRSSPPLDRSAADALSRQPEMPPRAPALAASRDQIAARIAACRGCPDAAPGASNCEACALRCAHPEAQTGAQLIARLDAICPAGLWPSSP